MVFNGEFPFFCRIFSLILCKTMKIQIPFIAIFFFVKMDEIQRKSIFDLLKLFC